MSAGLRTYRTRVRGTEEATPLADERAIYTLDDWSRLRRFLILGSEASKYSASGLGTPALTADNAQAVVRCLKEDGRRVVDEIITVSDEGLAVKNDPALFALALAASFGSDAVRSYALVNLEKVARTGTHLLHFVSYVTGQRGWGPALTKAVARWFNGKRDTDLAYQLVKYRQRDGWSMRDLLRLSHPLPVDTFHNLVYAWTVGKDVTLDLLETEDGDRAAGYLIGYEALARTTGQLSGTQVARIIRDYHLPREAVPTVYLNDVKVWEALLEEMPMTALVRNLATMTRLGMFEPFSANLQHVLSVLDDAERLRKSRLHPLAILSALKTYQQGHGLRGQNTWNPVGGIVDALDQDFYLAFKNVTPTGKNFLLALDVSGSMAGATVAGVQGLDAREVTAAMALVTAAVEKNTHIVAFSAGEMSYYGYGHRQRKSSGFVNDVWTPTNVPYGGIASLNISPSMRLDNVVDHISELSMSATDCSLPMLWARQKGIANVDGFVIYTDNETNTGRNPSTEMRAYRQACNPNARMVVVGTSSNDFTVAKPDDPLALDVVGFDSSAPAVISDFVAGRV